MTCCLARGLFGDEVPGRDRAAANLIGPGSPYLKRLVPAGEGAGITPQHENRAGDSPLSPVGLVVLVVKRRGGTVLLADRMDGLGSAELLDVLARIWAGKAPGTSDHESSMWSTRTAGALPMSCSGTGAGAARNDHTQKPRLKAMSARRNASPVGMMSSTASRVTRPGWSNAIR